jgi:hypothetical protein
LPSEQGGVQESLAQLIIQQTSNEQMMIILTTMWYIWKARNDRRFHNKSWTVWQVHHEVAADIDANSLHEQHQDGRVQHLLQPDVQPLNQDEAQVTVHDLHAGNRQQDDVHFGLGNFLPFAGQSTRRTDANQPQNQALPESVIISMPVHRVLLPALLQGARCYTDASTQPDTPQQVTRRAGLGVFIVNSHLQSTIYIKAAMTGTTSVLTAEAAALALAASCCPV